MSQSSESNIQAVSLDHTPSERCQKCGSEEPDLRTLWMSCFYAMDELPIPFAQVGVSGTVAKVVNVKRVSTYDIRVPEMDPNEANWQKLDRREFYCLRVCKTCRAEWMMAIQAWWETPSDVNKPTGTGAFIRVLGSNHEMSEEEIERFRKERGHEPVRVKVPDEPLQS